MGVNIINFNDKFIPEGPCLFVNEEFQNLWAEVVEKDNVIFLELYRALCLGNNFFPSHLRMKISIGEC